MATACHSFQMLLSAFADGEVNARQRAAVELHLSGCADCRARLADLQALDRLVSARLAQQADEADFAGFTDKVLQRIDPRRPGLLERLRVAWSEVMAYHRTAVISSLVSAAVTLLVAVPAAYFWAASRMPPPQVIVRDLQLHDPRLQPVVMDMGDGKTLIMVVGQPADAEPGNSVNFDTTPPTGGEL